MSQDLLEEPPRGGKAAILVVDDRPDKILVFRSVLEELGEEIISVSSGDDALKRVLERDFAVILLDVNMPGMDGFETATLIRNRRRSAHTPIIFMTAYSDEMHAAQAYSLGAVDFILTPFAPEVLRAKVRVFVNLHHMSEQVRRQSDQRIALAREQAARGAAEEAVRRAGYLADVGRLVTSTLDPERLIAEFTRFAVPGLGQLCAIALADEQGRARRTEIVWNDPAAGAGHRSFTARRLRDARLDGAITEAIASGQFHAGREGLGEAGTLEVESHEGGEAARLALGFEATALAVFPLCARGRTLGALALALAAPRVEFTRAELALCEEVAGRLSIALDNALLYRQVQDNDRRKDEFLAMLAHELRSPLAPIRNAIEVLKVMGPREDRWPWARDIIDRQSKQLVRIVDDLLDVSRITSGKIHLNYEAVDVAGVLAAAIETSRPLIDIRRHELIVEQPDGPLSVRGDSARIAQVLANLLNNAAKYTPPGGRIAVRVSADENEARFCVADNGAGIPAPMLERIFDLFAQVDQTLDRSHGGLGIGLTLVKRLVEAQGGRVEATSDGAGKGCEFTVSLPRATLASEQAAGAVASGAGPRHRVLIVEDQPDTAQTLQVLVAMAGHEVRNVRDGFEALGLVGEYRPNVLLVDIGLPGMDGFEIARRLRRDEATRESLLVAVTGYGQESDRKRALESGFDHHLVKPVNVQALMALLRERRPATEVS